MWTLLSYVGLGSAGVISTLFWLWRKSIVEKQRDVAISEGALAQDAERRYATELEDTRNFYKAELAKRDALISRLDAQRKQALDALEKSNAPGAIRDALRLSFGVLSQGDATKP